MTDVFAGAAPAPEVEVRFDDLVGEGKKYSDKEAAAKAIAEKDRFIARLQQEAAERSAALQKYENEKSFLDRLQEVTMQPPPQGQPPVEPPRGPADSRTEKVITDEDILRVVEERDAKRSREANLQEVTKKLAEVFGDNYKSRVQAQASHLGVGTEFLTDVAATNPSAFYRLMEMDKPQSPVRDQFAPPRSVAAPSAPSGKKDYTYFQNLRKEKGESWYFSPQTQHEIWRAAKEAEARGESFLPG
jgi:hypothetical protein